MNKLESLAKHTVIVADTGDIESIQKFKPTDATTNPSLIFQASQMEQYKDLVSSAVKRGLEEGSCSDSKLEAALDHLSVEFGSEILKIVPGRVSTEVDARLSFDARGSIEKAHRLIDLYSKKGIEKERILIKLATTWEGVEAARELEKEGIHCNMTLLFCQAQAIACAQADATLISPFVGRILDWYKKAEGKDSYPSHEDPGVVSVTSIYNYFKKFDYKTVVMGASFRNSGEILELAGCDLLTIAPKFLDELSSQDGDVEAKLTVDTAKSMDLEKQDLNESSFRWALNEDAMATEKLAEGIRNFAKDLVKLEDSITKQYL